jgi:hypothetical protein
LVQITRITPWRRMIRHFSHRFVTEADTFIAIPLVLAAPRAAFCRVV